LERELANLLAGCALANGADQAKLDAMAVCHQKHAQVLLGSDPLNRTDGDPIALSATQTSSLEQGLADAKAMAEQVRAAHRERALANQGIPAAFWASLVASCDQTLRGLSGPYHPQVDTAPLVPIAAMDETAAKAALLSAYHEAVYTTTAECGYLPTGSDWRQKLDQVLEAVRRRRDDLLVVISADGATPPAPQAAYNVPKPASTEAMLEMMATVDIDLSQAALSWVQAASEETRESAVTALSTAATIMMNLGVATQIWPGWPIQE
jgi:hypothetical protein